MNHPPNDDSGTPPDPSPNVMIHYQFTRFLRKLKRNLYRNRSLRPFYIVAPKGIVRYIKRFNWKSGLGVSLFGCGVVCGGYWVFCVDGGSVLMTTAGAIHGYYALRPINDSMNVIDLDVHQQNRSLLSHADPPRVPFSAKESVFGSTIRSVPDTGDSLMFAICSQNWNSELSAYSSFTECVQKLRKDIYSRRLSHDVVTEVAETQHGDYVTINYLLKWVEMTKINAIVYTPKKERDQDLSMSTHFLIGQNGQKHTKVFLVTPNTEGNKGHFEWIDISDLSKVPEWIKEDLQRMEKCAAVFDPSNEIRFGGESRYYLIMSPPNVERKNHMRDARLIHFYTESFPMTAAEGITMAPQPRPHQTQQPPPSRQAVATQTQQKQQSRNEGMDQKQKDQKARDQEAQNQRERERKESEKKVKEKVQQSQPPPPSLPEPKPGAPQQPPPSKPERRPSRWSNAAVIAVIVLLFSVPAACICIGLMIFIFVVQRRQANSAAMNHDAGEPPVGDMV